MDDTPELKSPDDIAEETLQVALNILNEIDSGDFGVTDWEANFIQSIMKQANTRWHFKLSDKQMAVIERMQEKYLL